MEAEPTIDSGGGRSLEFRVGPGASAIPIGVFIVRAVFQSGVLGIGDTSGLVVGMLVGLIAGLPFVRGVWKTYADAFFEGLEVRSATPQYEPGDELSVIVTGRDGDDALVRIGHPRLRLPDTDAAVDADDATGEAELR